MKKTTILLSLLIVSASMFAQLFSSIEQRKLTNAFTAISSLYVDSINEKKLAEAAIVAMLKELDPHSQFIPKEEVERVNEPLEGSFEGVGISFQMYEDTLLVVQTIAGCPAEKVGVMPGDRIIYIDGELIAGVKAMNSDIMKRLRGPKGTEVEVKILRGGNPELLLFKIIRDKIPVHSVDASYMIGRDIGYIKINNFGATTIEEYLSAFHALQKQGMKHLILSLQGNGGGYLNAAVQLADEFLGRGQLIVYTEGLNQPKNSASATALGGFESGRLVVLVDEYSASASEIVSGAIQDWDRGIVVGRRTFGKGLVQRQLPLLDGSVMRLTTARYYTPTGRSIQKPYKNGEDYQKDIMNRFESGELLHADSIHLPDSLQYKTLRLGRTVYGGGGIMPDIFVPIDTTRYTAYHRSLVSRGVVNKATIQYVNKNRDELKSKYPTFEKFRNEFQPSDEFLTLLKDIADKENIEYDEESYRKSETLIRLQLKALIARDLWEVNQYYQIIDQENESLQKAIQILQTPGMYDKLLKK